MAGYNRISPNPFVDGAIIEANDFDTEFGNLDIAFGTSGHNHDGTDGNGPKITTVGLADDAVTGDKIDSATTITAAAFVGPLTGNITSTNGTITNLIIGTSTAVTSVDTDLSSVSATDNSLASAKAIKAYVDAQVASENELTEMNDVVITSVADNEVLAYDNASSKWINQTAVEAGLQPNDAGLTSIAGLTTSADQMIYTTGSDTYATTSLTAAGRAILDDADASAQRTTLGLVIGTNVQAYDAGLNSIAGLTTTANKMIYTTASDTYAVTDLSAYGRSLIDDADAATARTTLGLGTAATTAATAYATAAQGALADSAVQPGDNISGLTNDSGYITGYTVTESDVTAHEAALSITESQISDLGAYLTAETNDLTAAVTWANVPDANITQSSVTQHQAALSITESQISDLQSYLTGNQTITLSGDATGSGTTSIAVTLAANTVGVNELALSDGTAGQFLKTDGAGTISFADAPTQQTSFTTLDVDNLNLDGNTISATSGGVVLYTEGNGGFILSAGDGGGFGNPNVPPTLWFIDRGAAGSVGTYDSTGRIYFQAPDEDAIDTVYAQINAYMDPDASTSGRLAITVASNGDAGPGTGGIGFDLDGKNDRIFIYGADLMFTSGRGIDFSLNSDATGMTSELLDDYEEGTFTPYFAGNTDYNDPTYYSRQNGWYTKVGRVVHFSIEFRTTSLFPDTSSDTGFFKVKGLPFTSAAHASVITSGANAPFRTTPQTAEINSGQAEIVAGQSSGDNSFIALAISSLGDPDSTTLYYNFSGSYIV